MVWWELRVVFSFVEPAIFYLFLATASAAHPACIMEIFFSYTAYYYTNKIYWAHMLQTVVQFFLNYQIPPLVLSSCSEPQIVTACSFLRSYTIKQMSFAEAVFSLLSSHHRTCESVSSCPVQKNELNSNSKLLKWRVSFLCLGYKSTYKKLLLIRGSGKYVCISYGSICLQDSAILTCS